MFDHSNQPMKSRQRDNFRRSRAPVFSIMIGGLVLVAILASLWGRASASTSQTARVRCDPVNPVGTIDSPIVVDMYIENVVDLYGADVRMSFDPSAVQVIDADPGAGGTQILPLDVFLSPDFVVRRVADNSAGTIWYASTQVNPSEPATGSGPLARITFQPLRATTTPLRFTFVQLGARGGVEIPSSSQDCQIVLIDNNPDLATYLPVVFANWP